MRVLRRRLVREAPAGNDPIHVLECRAPPQDGDGIERICLGVSVCGHGLEVIGEDAAEVARDAQSGIHVVYPVDEGGRGRGIGLLRAGNARVACESGQLGGDGVSVGAQDVRENDRVGQAVRRAILSAKAVRDGVNVANVGLRERDASLVRRREHVASGLLVAPVLVCLEQVVMDKCHGVERHLARVVRRTAANERLDRVSERVHARLAGDGRGQVGREAPVVDGDAWDEGKVVDGVLVVGLLVRDDGGKRYLASRSRRGGYGDEQWQPAVHAKQSPHAAHGLAWLRDACPHCLGAVHGRAPAKADDGLAGALEVEGASLLYVGNGGVGNGLVVRGARNPRAGKRILEPARKANLGDAAVRHEKHRGDAMLAQHLGYLLDRVEDARLAIGQYGQDDSECRLVCAAPGFS